MTVRSLLPKAALVWLFAAPFSVWASQPTGAESATPAAEWYSCAGTFTLVSAGATYTFSGLQLRKVDGQSFEIRGADKGAPSQTLLLQVRTLNPDQILRPGTTYVSEGSLENGETFQLFVLDGAAQPRLLSAEAGCVFKVGSVRGGSVRGELSGQMLDGAGQPQQFTASFDVIDARYGR